MMTSAQSAELFAFVGGQPGRRLDSSTRSAVWDRITDTHAAGWLRQQIIPHPTHVHDPEDRHYVDDHALAQIPRALPLLGLPRDQQMTITRGDGTQVLAPGFEDPQAMRMILLQILTGRRLQRDPHLRVRLPVTGSRRARRRPDRAEEVARFRYAQSKIDTAPDTIWSTVRSPRSSRSSSNGSVNTSRVRTTAGICSCSGPATAAATSPTRRRTYNWMLREFSDVVRITDSRGRR